ncbi:MAG: hypothetical protein ACI4U2_01985 [Christensenellaceae bacterium]
MSNTSEIRKINVSHIRQVMMDGQEYTVQKLAQLTGLSVATCNTIAKLLAAEGELTAEKRRLSEVGRSSAIYRINTEYKSLLFLCCEEREQRKYLKILVSYLYGGMRASEEVECDGFDQDTVLEVLLDCLKRYGSVVRAAVAVPDAASVGEWLTEFVEGTAIVKIASAKDYAARSLQKRGRAAVLTVREGTLIDAFLAHKGEAIECETGRFSSGEECVQAICALFRPDVLFVTGVTEAELSALASQWSMATLPPVERLESLSVECMSGMLQEARWRN